MNKKWLASTALVISVLVSVGCGASQPSGRPPAAAGQQGETAVVTEPKEMTPVQLGQQIGAVYVEAIVEVTRLVADRPPAATVKPKIEEMKEIYIQKLVELGWKREALSEGDRAIVDGEVRAALDALYRDKAQWDAYGAAVRYYAAEDFEVNQLLADFNVIGQYASFDLLKQQLPAEAERLGIK